MMTTESLTAYRHIVRSADGTAFIEGSTTKVVELVAERLAWGWSAEELVLNHPHLSLAQVYSALAYYADHRTEFEAVIDQQLVTYDRAHADPDQRALARMIRERAEADDPPVHG